MSRTLAKEANWTTGKKVAVAVAIGAASSLLVWYLTRRKSKDPNKPKAEQKSKSDVTTTKSEEVAESVTKSTKPDDTATMTRNEPVLPPSTGGQGDADISQGQSDTGLVPPYSSLAESTASVGFEKISLPPDNNGESIVVLNDSNNSLSFEKINPGDISPAVLSTVSPAPLIPSESGDSASGKGERGGEEQSGESDIGPVEEEGGPGGSSSEEEDDEEFSVTSSVVEIKPDALMAEKALNTQSEIKTTVDKGAGQEVKDKPQDDTTDEKENGDDTVEEYEDDFEEEPEEEKDGPGEEKGRPEDPDTSEVIPGVKGCIPLNIVDKLDGMESFKSDICTNIPCKPKEDRNQYAEVKDVKESQETNTNPEAPHVSEQDYDVRVREVLSDMDTIRASLRSITELTSQSAGSQTAGTESQSSGDSFQDAISNVSSEEDTEEYADVNTSIHSETNETTEGFEIIDGNEFIISGASDIHVTSGSNFSVEDDELDECANKNNNSNQVLETNAVLNSLEQNVSKYLNLNEEFVSVSQLCDMGHHVTHCIQEMHRFRKNSSLENVQFEAEIIRKIKVDNVKCRKGLKASCTDSKDNIYFRQSSLTQNPVWPILLTHPNTKQPLEFGCNMETNIVWIEENICQITHRVKRLTGLAKIAAAVPISVGQILLTVNGIQCSSMDGDTLQAFLQGLRLTQPSYALSLRMARCLDEEAISSLDESPYISWRLSIAVTEHDIALEQSFEEERPHEKDVTDLNMYEDRNCIIRQCWIKHQASDFYLHINDEGCLALATARDQDPNFVFEYRGYVGVDDGNTHPSKRGQVVMVTSFKSTKGPLAKFMVAASDSSVDLMMLPKIRESAKVLRASDPRLFYMIHNGNSVVFQALAFPGQSKYLAASRTGQRTPKMNLKNIPTGSAKDIVNDPDVNFVVYFKDG